MSKEDAGAICCRICTVTSSLHLPWKTVSQQQVLRPGFLCKGLIKEVLSWETVREPGKRDRGGKVRLKCNPGSPSA